MRYSTSRHKLFNRCKRLYYYHYILGYRETFKAPWLTYGSNIDDLLAIYDTDGIDKAKASISDYFSSPFDRFDVELLLDLYNEKLGSTPLPPLTVEGKPGNQFEFNIKVKPSFVTNCDIELHGFLDKVCSHDSYPAFVERKTTSANISYTAPYWNGLRMDKQIVSYSYAMSEILGGPVDTCFYEVVRKLNTSLAPCFNRKHSSGKRKGEFKTIEEYITGVMDKESTWRKKDIIVRRKYIIKQTDRDEWLMDLLADDDHMKTIQLNQTTLENNDIGGQYAWPRNQSGCDAYGGCAFIDACQGNCQVGELNDVAII